MGKVKEFKRKIKDSELKELKEILSVQSKIKSHIAELEIQKHGAFRALDESDMKMSIFQKSLRESYGDINVNIADGTITQANAKN